MSDWARPEPDRPADTPRIEVPLAHGSAPDAPSGSADLPPTPNWRRTTGLSALAGIALGLVVAVVLLTAGADDDPPATTLDPDELSDAITVPPTLTPRPEPTAATTPPTSEPTSAPGPERVAASVATLPARTDADRVPVDGFLLSDGSLAALDTPLPRRSVTDYVVGADGFEQTVTITNDPSTARYLLEFELGRATQRVVVDLIGGLTYLQPDNTGDGSSEWVTIPNDEVAANTGAPDMATFLRNLQLGPIRSDTRGGWELVQANGLVDTTGDELREWVVVLDATAVPEWARYAFGPSSEAAPLPADTDVGFAVYVAADGSIRRVTGSAEFGSTSQRIAHRIEELDVAPVIELPVADEPVTPEPTVPASVPATVPPDG
jgi:hypothetical protein